MNPNNTSRTSASRLMEEIRLADRRSMFNRFPGFDDEDFDGYVSLDELESYNWMDDDEEDEEW